jgi:hypothetical protein
METIAGQVAMQPERLWLPRRGKDTGDHGSNGPADKKCHGLIKFTNYLHHTSGDY